MPVCIYMCTTRLKRNKKEEATATKRERIREGTHSASERLYAAKLKY